MPGCAIDFSAGVLFHARIQHLDNTAEHTYFTGLSLDNSHFIIGQPGPESLNRLAWRNWMAKHFSHSAPPGWRRRKVSAPGDPAFEPTRAGSAAPRSPNAPWKTRPYGTAGTAAMAAKSK